MKIISYFWVLFLIPSVMSVEKNVEASHQGVVGDSQTQNLNIDDSMNYILKCIECIDNILEKSMPEDQRKEFRKQTQSLLEKISNDKDPLNKARNLNNLFQILKSFKQIMELPEDESNNRFIQLVIATIESLKEQ